MLRQRARARWTTHPARYGSPSPQSSEFATLVNNSAG
jgi:hypothetical protein